MTEQQDVLDPRRSRRRTPVILLGILPVAIAATVLVAGPSYVTPTESSLDASGANHAQITPGVIAPGSVTNVDLKSSVQKITVTLPKPKVVAPPARFVPMPVSVSVSVRGTKATEAAVYRQATTTTTATTVKTSSMTYRQFCANPSNPIATTATTGKALFYLVNKERA